MADINELAKKIFKWEGGYQAMKEDNGNYLDGKLIGTNRGVTPGAYKQTFGKTPTIADMKALTVEQATEVMRKFYWNPWMADNITDQKLANLLVDFSWASGPVTAIKKIQRLLGLSDDGKVGPATLNKLNNTPGIFESIWNYRKRFLESIVANNPSQSKFLKGWMNRLNDFK